MMSEMFVRCEWLWLVVWQGTTILALGVVRRNVITAMGSMPATDIRPST